MWEPGMAFINVSLPEQIIKQGMIRKGCYEILLKEEYVTICGCAYCALHNPSKHFIVENIEYNLYSHSLRLNSHGCALLMFECITRLRFVFFLTIVQFKLR